MNRSGFKYLQARKKGLLSPRDFKTRVEFAKYAEKELGEEFWTHGVSFYADAVSFGHKYNPFDTALSCRSMVWRKPGEGLRITTKGSKVGAGTPRVFKIMVGIAYDVGVVMCLETATKLTGVEFASIIRDDYPAAIQRCTDPDDPLILQVLLIIIDNSVKRGGGASHLDGGGFSK